jgi:hypothetical protein
MAMRTCVRVTPQLLTSTPAADRGTGIAEDVTRRHQKMRALLVAEAGGACAVCGYDRCSLPRG